MGCLFLIEARFKMQLYRVYESRFIRNCYLKDCYLNKKVEGESKLRGPSSIYRFDIFSFERIEKREGRAEARSPLSRLA